uniref:Uncharacterized protein n=1 Tax=Strongyloides stercoralis TaxID=6248 RepID=A0A0K0DU37_STRER
MLLCLFQISLHIFITLTISFINCGGKKKEEQHPGELRGQIVLARAEEVNDQDTLNRTMVNEITRLKEELKSYKDVNKNNINDNVGCTPFPTPVTTPFPEELKAIDREKTMINMVQEEHPQVFRV